MNLNTKEKLLEKVKDNYNKIALEFSESREKKWHDFNLFTDLCSSGDKVLDAACGTGRFYEYVRDLDVNYIGCDNSKELLKIAKSKYGDFYDYGDLLSLPYSDKEFDVVFCFAAFHHIPSDELRIKCLKELKRVLKDDGKIVVTVWNLWQKRYKWVAIKALIKSIFTFGKYEYNDFVFRWNKGSERYYHAFRPGKFRKLLEKEFVVEDFFYSKRGKKVGYKESFNICAVISKNG